VPIFRSFAKVNLHLEVVRRRPDGFHELRTIFTTVDLADELEIEPAAAGVELEVEAGEAPDGPTNLAHRAASRFLERWRGLPGVRIRLRKRIPVGGGLGGGSANAATTLLALARLAGRSIPESELSEVAAELGADVPFFLTGGRALGEGRGDRMTPLPDLASPLTLWLAVPPFALSTAAVFAALPARAGRDADPRVRAALDGHVPATVEEAIGLNDLEEPAFRLRPELAAVYTRLVRSRARAVRMSGSGSTVFAVFDDPEDARAGGVDLPPGYAWIRVETLGRAAWKSASGFGAFEGGD